MLYVARILLTTGHMYNIYIYTNIYIYIYIYMVTKKEGQIVGRGEVAEHIYI